MSHLPLEGIRILDLSVIWAGPFATRLLADLGAEVIKVEALSFYDIQRGPVAPTRGHLNLNYPDGDPGQEPWNRSAWFNTLHINKLGITLELTRSRGRELFMELVGISDVVIENFRYGVREEKLGLSFQVLREARPDLILVSMPAFGNSGPWRTYAQYGIGQEMLAGFPAMTGYLGGQPTKSGINHGDPIAGTHAAGAIVAALLRRRRTGRGAFIDLSQQESTICFMGEQILGYQMTGERLEPGGNRDEAMAPHGVYPCRGEDRWIAIAVGTDEAWQALCRCMGRAELAAQPEYATAPARYNNQDALDALLSDWARNADAGELAARLQRSGIAASPVNSPRELMEDAHYHARGAFVTVNHPVAGSHRYPGAPFKLSESVLEANRPAPTLGRDNAHILGELLGHPQPRLEELESTGIIGTVPRDTERARSLG